jgi:hypothetical protein
MNRIRNLLALLLGCVLASPALGITTSHWTDQNEADFKAGTLHNVVVTNLGDVKLSRAVQTIQDQNPDVTTVNALAEGPDGTVYAGTGPKGVLLAVKNDKVTTVATLDNTVNILCLIFDDKGALLIGTGGDKGRVMRIEKPGERPREIFTADDVQYIWALQRTPDGTIYAATGPNGQVFQINPDGSHSELYKSSEDNITAMLSDGRDMLYLGTDPDGYVVRLNRKTKESFILYNAAESEITALAMDEQGNLFAATGEVADRQQPQQPEQENKQKEGRPEAQNTAAPIPSNPAPAPPKPPPLPNPGPGGPKPIPKQSSLRFDLSDSPMMMSDQPGMDQPGGDQPGGGGGDQPGSGADNGNADNAQNAPPNQHGPNPAVPPANANQQRPEGNAIYKIDREGFVTEIFRENAVIYSMITQGDLLLVGTGGEGNIYQVKPAAEETVVLAKVDAKQVICLLPAKDGRIFMGLANAGGVSAMTGGYATDGTYISPVLDATQVSRFGKMQLHGQLPDGTHLKIATRSGNVRDGEAPGWSKWTDDVDAAEYVKVQAPPARFLQYRLTFSTAASDATALVDRVDVAYQMPNMGPLIKSIKIGGGADASASPENASGDNASAQGQANQGPPAPQHVDTSGKAPAGTGSQTISWDASDPNGDTLIYTLYFRLEQNGPWILLRDKLKDPTFEWDTRTVADGRYQVKVVASDALSNQPGEGKTTARVSDYYVVDNTPPTIGDIVTKVTATDVSINLRAQDQTSIIAAVEYTVDSSDQWQTVLPVDRIYDSPSEEVAFTLKGLAPGMHQVTVRATDSHGNQALQTITVKIEAGTARGN